MIHLTHPWFLALLLVLPLLALAMTGSLTGMTRPQRVVCYALRCLILALIALSLAGIRLSIKSDDLAVLFLVDGSASISDEAQKQARDFITASLPGRRAHDESTAIGFAKQPKILQASLAGGVAQHWPSPTARNSTDVGKALSFAGAVISPDKARRIVLLSDGNDTGESGPEIARKLALSGIELFTVPLKNPALPEVLAEQLDVPRRIQLGEPFDLTAKIRSNVETPATVKFYQNQFLIGQTQLRLKPGLNDASLRRLKPEGHFVTYEAEVIPERDTKLENNRVQAAVSLRGEPRVLIVDRDEEKIRPLAAALRAENIHVELRGIPGLPKSLEDLQPFDLFILSDVSSLHLTHEQMEIYRLWVQDFGGGFVMLGGEESFGVGGYFRTPVEQMLPVRSEHEDRIDMPIVALLVILDRSGSMAAQVQGQTKMSLADKGAAYALEVLQPKDLFGLFAVDTRVHTVAPLARVDNKSSVEQNIMNITAGGGGIYIYTSLLEAFQQLRDANAKIKHVILFSDAADAEEKSAGQMPDGTQGEGSSLDVATVMQANKISLSVVALGFETDKDTGFLRELAERGNGRFYITSDALNLPQIFSTETMRVAQSSLVEEPFAAIPTTGEITTGASNILAGIDWKNSPLLLGYNTVKPKPTASVLLNSERGDPLLATWRYGLGQTAAFTSDAKSRWASEWLSWAGYGKFWAQLVRGLMRKNDPSGLQVTTTETDNHLTLHIDAVTPEGGFRNELPITVNSVGTNGSTATVQARQDAPGSYSASVELPPEASALLSISTSQASAASAESLVFGYTRSYPKEFLTTDTNEPYLRSLAETGHGKYAPAPAEIFARPHEKTTQRLDITSYLLGLALILFPLDIWLRRRP